MLEHAAILLMKSDKQTLQICEDVEKEFVTVGDADEPIMFMSEVYDGYKKTEVVKNKFSKDLINTSGLIK